MPGLTRTSGSGTREGDAELTVVGEHRCAVEEGLQDVVPGQHTGKVDGHRIGAEIVDGNDAGSRQADPMGEHGGLGLFDHLELAPAEL